MTEKWYVDPSWDPMQDLADCKHNISVMVPALEEHATVIKSMLGEQRVQTLLIKRQMAELDMLKQEIHSLRHLLETQRNSQ
jgi:hypothetical protein